MEKHSAVYFPLMHSTEPRINNSQGPYAIREQRLLVTRRTNNILTGKEPTSKPPFYTLERPFCNSPQIIKVEPNSFQICAFH